MCYGCTLSEAKFAFARPSQCGFAFPSQARVTADVARATRADVVVLDLVGDGGDDVGDGVRSCKGGGGGRP